MYLCSSLGSLHMMDILFCIGMMFEFVPVAEMVGLDRKWNKLGIVINPMILNEYRTLG